MPPNPLAEIRLAYSRTAALAAIAHGEQYQWANTALDQAGLHQTGRRKRQHAQPRRSPSPPPGGPPPCDQPAVPRPTRRPLAADQQKEGILLCPTTSASVPIPNTVSSPPPHRASPLTWPSGSSSASSSSPSPFRRACTGSPSRNAMGCAVPAKPSTTCAASATACRPTFAPTRPSPPAHHARTGRTGSRSAAAVSPKQQPAERRSAPHRPPLPRPRPDRSHRSPPTHRPST